MERYVKKIDKFGKITIPKPVIDRLELDNVELIIKNNVVIIRNYSPLLRIKYFIKDICSSLSYALNHNVIISDLNTILISSEKKLINKKISSALKTSIFRRENILEIHNKKLVLTNDYKLNTAYIINSIMLNGEVIGLLVIYDKIVDNIDYKISGSVVRFIEKYIA